MKTVSNNKCDFISSFYKHVDSFINRDIHQYWSGKGKNCFKDMEKHKYL